MKKLAFLSAILVSLFSIVSSTFGLPDASTPVSYTPPDSFKARTSTYNVNLNSIVRIRCGNMLGTASVIDKDVLISASHVTVTPKCRMEDGTILDVIYNDVATDFAILKGDTGNRERVPVSCKRFETTKSYLMIGYPRGVDFAINRGTAMAEYRYDYAEKTLLPITHVRTLAGRVYGGMSGGPIIGADGVMIGIINAQRIDFEVVLSRELADTILCPALGETKPAADK